MSSRSTRTMTRYYYAGGQRVAVRNSDGTGTDGLVFLINDHLGSTSLSSDPVLGQKLTELRPIPQGWAMPWGEGRYSGFFESNMPTDNRFTGQKSEMAALGLYFYNARMYDPALGRFISADTLIPEPYDSQSWDRYAAMVNNPVNNIDPTGHQPNDPPSFLNPFSYDTVSLTFRGLAKAVVGIDLDINISVDTRSFREGYAKGGLAGGVNGFLNNGAVAVTTTVPVSVGVSLEGFYGVGITGSDGGVLDQYGVNVIGEDGATFNYSANILSLETGAPNFIPFGSTTFDGRANNGIASSQTWGVGYGAGLADVSIDAIDATDWMIYMDNNTTALQVPYFNEKFGNAIENVSESTKRRK